MVLVAVAVAPGVENVPCIGAVGAAGVGGMRRENVATVVPAVNGMLGVARCGRCCCNICGCCPGNVVVVCVDTFVAAVVLIVWCWWRCCRSGRRVYA